MSHVDISKEEVKKYLDTLNLIFYGIVAVPLVAFSYLYLENHAGRIYPQVSSEVIAVLQYFFPTVIIIMYGLGVYVPNLGIRRIDPTQPLKAKLIEFQKQLILRYIFFEAAGICSVVAFYLSAQSFYSLFFIITLVLFSLNRPTPYRVIWNLQLKGEEKNLL